MRIYVYRNNPRSSPHRKSWGCAKLATMTFYWCGPLFIRIVHKRRPVHRGCQSP